MHIEQPSVICACSHIYLHAVHHSLHFYIQAISAAAVIKGRGACVGKIHEPIVNNLLRPFRTCGLCGPSLCCCMPQILQKFDVLRCSSRLQAVALTLFHLLQPTQSTRPYAALLCQLVPPALPRAIQDFSGMGLWQQNGCAMLKGAGQ